MSFLRYLGGRSGAGQPAMPSTPADTEAVRRIVERLEALPPDTARLLAETAYVLARAANADMQITDVETAAIEQSLVEAGLDSAQAVLVAEMAKLQERTSGGTSDYLVTRQLRDQTTPEQRMDVLRVCYKVAAADGGISGAEVAVLDQIANEMDLDRQQAAQIRAEFADSISARFNLRPQQ